MIKPLSSTEKRLVLEKLLASRKPTMIHASILFNIAYGLNPEDVAAILRTIPEKPTEESVRNYNRIISTALASSGDWVFKTQEIPRLLEGCTEEIRSSSTIQKFNKFVASVNKGNRKELRKGIIKQWVYGGAFVPIIENAVAYVFCKRAGLQEPGGVRTSDRAQRCGRGYLQKRAEELRTW